MHPAVGELANRALRGLLCDHRPMAGAVSDPRTGSQVGYTRVHAPV